MNLRPLWSPAAGALSSLAERFGDIVWRLTFEELQNVTQMQIGSKTAKTPDWMKGISDDEDDDADVMEDERSWRDPSAHKLRSAVGTWLRDDHQRNEIIKVSKFFD